MKTIPLTQGKEALVDDGDYDFLMRWKWHAVQQRDGNYVARRTVRCSGVKKCIFMHREVNKTPHGMDTDHKDCNTLNNCRENLRTATPSQNSMNRRKQSNNTSGLKGVSWNASSGKWASRICKEGTPICIGYFTEKLDAYDAYKKEQEKLHGEFARV